MKSNDRSEKTLEALRKHYQRNQETRTYRCQLCQDRGFILRQGSYDDSPAWKGKKGATQEPATYSTRCQVCLNREKAEKARDEREIQRSHDSGPDVPI